jgi:hypothetical protein
MVANMRNFCEYFKVDKKPILAPDQDLGISKQDLDAEGSGRDELGFMHRIVLRGRVGTWNLNYSTLSEYEYEYMNTLLEKPEFDLEIRIGSKEIKTRGYCSSVKSSLHNVIKGTYKGVSFTIIEC